MDQKAKLASLIKGIPMAMLTTVTSEGKLHSRPMATQQVEFDGTLWFFTRDNSAKVYELYENRDVNVTYADPDSNRFVAVYGTGEIVKDKAKIHELWKPSYKAWFPDGVDDPHLALIKFDVEGAEYWEGPTGPRLYLEMAKAAIMGKFSGTHNEKLDLRMGT